MWLLCLTRRIVSQLWPLFVSTALRCHVTLPETKVSRFAGQRAARAIVGQARSTIDPSGWLRSGAIVIVNTAKGTVGEDTAALIGGTLINLVVLLVSEQAQLPERRRRPVTLIVDELQTMVRRVVRR